MQRPKTFKNNYDDPVLHDVNKNMLISYDGFLTLLDALETISKQLDYMSILIEISRDKNI